MSTTAGVDVNIYRDSVEKVDGSKAHSLKKVIERSALPVIENNTLFKKKNVFEHKPEKKNNLVCLPLYYV
jgi:hypothetical protein